MIGVQAAKARAMVQDEAEDSDDEEDSDDDEEEAKPAKKAAAKVCWDQLTGSS